MAAAVTGLERARRMPPSIGDLSRRDRIFDVLVREHRIRLYHFILRRVGNSADAEEITQDAFVEAACSYGSWRGEAQLSTWLYGIAMNLLRNHLNRSPQRRFLFDSDESLLLEVADGGSVEQVCEHKQAVLAMVGQLDGLPSEMREILVLIGMQQLSYEEASEVLGIPVGTVRSRLSRARSTLRRQLERVHPCLF